MNIINMLLIFIDLAATGKIITCTGKKVDPILHDPRGGGGGGGDGGGGGGGGGGLPP